ncbi:MAG TPA: glutathione peroxidase, partial [Candidatus Binatia bacterium]|nr:glutathione peroxidase [Candidatus Binatia bacterium]
MRTIIFVLLLLGVCGLIGDAPGQAEQEGPLMAAKTAGLYDFTLDDIDGKPVNLGTYKGKVLLLVNTASLCGNTPQYSDLERIYEQ